MFAALVLSLFSMSVSCSKDSVVKPALIATDTAACDVDTIQLIYDKQKHCAFTDLIKFENNYYLTFRVSDAHVYGKDGHVIVLKSPNGKDWTQEVDFSEPGLDLRDPKFNITNNNHLVFYTQGVQYNTDKSLKTQRGLIVEATKPLFESSQPTFMNFPENQVFWPWRFTKYNNAFYAIAYNQNPHVFKLIKSKDLKTVEDVHDLSTISMAASESTIRFYKGKCYVLIRRNGPTLLGVADANNLSDFKWTELPMFGLGGPNFIFYDDNTLLICGRDYTSPGDYSYGSMRTSLFVYRIKENKTTRVLTLPTWGDTSYPGLYLNKNNLWISYYSTDNVSTKVYLAKTRLTLNK
ncbi:hypothetical protein [Chitinophaga arvensicola]|uniref:Uncharacterized protein n=1 Tax=Chitinophaga arvensicola TaxID=29529 RepID=A0A1I0NPD8_9BACT|nr:hypothetical protein [Chitinophaga arvensicola]SEW03333.1 hypothetical protein SAMN04488122_0298 [Chitinophaga arvensicola]